MIFVKETVRAKSILNYYAINAINILHYFAYANFNDLKYNEVPIVTIY